MYNLHFRPTLRFGHDLSVLKTTRKKKSRTRHQNSVRETRELKRENDDDDDGVEENEIL